MNMGRRKGMGITEEDMARKVGISELQLYAYLKGEDPVPADLPSRLYAAYNIRRHIVMASKAVHIRTPEPARDGPAQAASDRRSLKSIVSFIKSIGAEKGMNITDEEIALKAGISIQQFEAYLNGRKKVTNTLSTVLWSAYAGLIDSHQMEAMRESLKHTVVLIRNRGLAVGADITVKDMAGAIGVPGEMLYAYINDEKDLPQDYDISFRLRSAYKNLLSDVERVELLEDINMIKAPPGMGRASFDI